MHTRMLPLLLLGLLCCGLRLAGSEVDKLKEQIKQAASSDNAGGVGVLVGLLNQVLARVETLRNNEGPLREWEELAQDIQDDLAALKSPEAHKLLASALNGMPPQGQVILALALKNHGPNKEADETAVKLLGLSKDFQVQVACMDMLAAHRDKDGIENILKLLKPTSLVPVQVSACRALAYLPDPRSVEGLIAYLDAFRGSRMRFDAVAALRAITGQTFNADASTWKGWWEKNKDAYKPPAETKPVFDFELTGETKEAKEEVSYYEIPIVENRVIFIIDCSGSMQLGGTPNRIERVRNELKELIGRLNERVLFNIICYSNNVRRWMKDPALVPANAANKKLACAFMDTAQAVGGTDTISALEEAMRQVALINGVETVFLLSDGAPNPMRHSDVKNVDQLGKGCDDIRRRVRYINQTLKIRINTIGVYTKAASDAAKLKGAKEPDPKVMKEFLEKLAQENDGVYKEVN